MHEWKDFRGEMPQGPQAREACEAHAIERELARAVMKQRLAQHVTQEEMAGKMHVPQGNVSRLESGTRTPTIATLQKAAQALGVSMEIRFGSQVVTIND